MLHERRTQVPRSAVDTRGTVARSDDVDVSTAVAAACSAQPSWATLTPVERGRLVRELALALQDRRDDLAAAFVEETRLAEATRRLSSQRVTVDMVAHSVGYPTTDTFRRAFERRYGVTPTDFLRRFASPGTRQAKMSIRARPHP